MVSAGGNVSQLVQQVSKIQENKSLHYPSTEYNSNISQLIRTNINVFIAQFPPQHRMYHHLYIISKVRTKETFKKKGTNIDNGIELTFLLKHFDHFTCKEYGNIITEKEYSVITVKCAVVHQISAFPSSTTL